MNRRVTPHPPATACVSDPTLGLTLTATGAGDCVARYLHALGMRVPAPGDPLANDDASDGDDRKRFCLDVQLSQNPPPPPASARQMNDFWFEQSTVFQPVDDAWMSIESTDENQWRLVRPEQVHDVSMEHALMRLSSLRSGGLPLHASVGRTDDLGLAAVGAAGSGKTGVLIALLFRGGDWICDDLAFCDPDLSTAHGYVRTMDVKHGYFRERPELLKWTTARDRRQLKAHAIARRLAGTVGLLPVGARARSRLSKISTGQSRLHIAPDGLAESTTIDTLLLVRKGSSTRLTPMEPEAWALQAGELLWMDARFIHDLHRCLQASTGGALLTGEVDDERLLKKRVQACVEGKRTFSLVRAPETTLEELDRVLHPLWSTP